MPENGVQLVHKHNAAYQSVYGDALTAQRAGADAKPEALKKLAADLAQVQKDDPGYYGTIVKKLNEKFKPEELGLAPGEKLLGGVVKDNVPYLVTGTKGGDKLHYYAEGPAGDSKTGKSMVKVGDVDNSTLPGDPKKGFGRLTQKADGSGQYTEGANDHSQWDVARHILGYDKLDTLAKKNEVANLIKLLNSDPENAQAIKKGTVIHIPAGVLGHVPDAPAKPQEPAKSVEPPKSAEPPKPAYPGGIAPDLKPPVPPAGDQKEIRPLGAPPAAPPPEAPKVQLTRRQEEDPISNSTLNELSTIHNIHQKDVHPDQIAAALAAKGKEESQALTQAVGAVFGPKGAEVLGIQKGASISMRDVHDYLEKAQSYADAHKDDKQAKELVDGLTYMRSHWGKFRVEGAMVGINPTVSEKSFQEIMTSRGNRIQVLEQWSQQWAKEQ